MDGLAMLLVFMVEDFQSTKSADFLTFGRGRRVISNPQMFID
jgi:hypothetical protein